MILFKPKYKDKLFITTIWHLHNTKKQALYFFTHFTNSEFFTIFRLLVCHKMGRSDPIVSKSESKSVWVYTPLKAPAVSLNKKFYPHCPVLVCLRSGFHNQTKNKWGPYNRLPFMLNKLTRIKFNGLYNFVRKLFALHP